MFSGNQRWMLGLTTCILTVAWVTSQAQAASLDKGLLKGSEGILDELVNKVGQGAVVGVLPFRVQKGGRAPGYNAAPLATSLPGRLENALIASQSSASKNPIKVIRDVSAQASKAKVGSWVKDKKAFDKLFGLEYDLAWGTAKRKADAFLTGEVICPPDDRSHTLVKVYLLLPKSFSGGDVDLGKPIQTIKVTTDRTLLRDLGYAYALPRALVKAKGAKSRDLDEQAVQQVTQDDQGKVQTPDQKKQGSHTPDNFAGFKVEIEYNKVKQTIAAKQGVTQGKQPTYRVDAAKPGEEVVIYLTRIAEDAGKLGAVIKVNGKSVFEEQEQETIGCKKWIYSFEDRNKRWDFAGFYTKGDDSKLKVRKFKVLTKEDSDVKITELGSRAGWIDIEIFTSGGSQPQPTGEDDLLISTRGAVKARGTTLKDVQDRVARANNLKIIKSRAKFHPRGLILVETEPVDSDPYKSDELPNPRSVGGLSIQYYENTSGKTID